MCLLALVLTLGFVAAHEAGAVEIIWASDPVRPDETVLVMGDGFGDGATVEVGRVADGPATATDIAAGATPEVRQWQRAEALQVSRQSMKFVIPEAWQMGAFAFRVSSRRETSQPVVVNGPDPWWMQGDGGNGVASPGDWLRIFGKGLSLGRQSQVLLAAEREHLILKPKDATCYALTIEVPDSVAEGEYTVYVHNGFGADRLWREAGTVRVTRSASWKADAFDVAEFRAGGASDTEAIKAALSAAEQNGGGIVRISRGAYTVEETLEMPRFVVLRGEARELVSLTWPDRQDPLPALIRGTNSFAVEDLTIYANNHLHGIEAERGHREGAGNVRVRRVRMRLSRLLGVSDRRFDDWRAEAQRRGELPGRTAAIQVGGDNIEVTDCDVYCSALFEWGTTLGLILDRARGALIARNRFYGPYRTTCITRGGDGLIFEDNAIQGGCFLGTHHTPGDSFGGGGSLINPFFQNLYFHANRVHDNVWWDREMLAFDSHGPAGVYVGGVTSAEGTHLTLDTQGGYYSDESWKTGDAGWGSRWKGAAVYVLDGKGAGQYRRVTGGAGAVVQVNRPWDIVPDASSRISIAKFHGRALLIGNEFTDGGNVFWWGGGTDCIMAENRASRFGCFLTTTGFIYKGLMPNWYCQFLDNEIVEGNASWGGTSKFGTVTYPLPLDPPVYDGPLSRCGIHRRNTCHSNSFVDISGATTDAIVEHCTIHDSATGITVTSRGDAVPGGVLVRENRLGNVDTPISGDAADRALVIP